MISLVLIAMIGLSRLELMWDPGMEVSRVLRMTRRGPIVLLELQGVLGVKLCLLRRLEVRRGAGLEVSRVLRSLMAVVLQGVELSLVLQPPVILQPVLPLPVLGRVQKMLVRPSSTSILLTSMTSTASPGISFSYLKVNR